VCLWVCACAQGLTERPGAGLVLAAGSSAALRWLLAPREAAALREDVWYYIGGSVT
jgi:hypothetical protein